MDLEEIQKKVDERMKTEMDEMAVSLEEPDAGFEEPRTDPPGTEVPGTEAISTDAPGTETPSTDAPTTDAPVEDPRDVELRALREEVEKLKEGPKPTESPSTEAPTTDAPISIENFLGDADLDELTRDPKLFNKLMNEVYVKALTQARAELRSGIESTVRSIPDIVKNTTTVQAQLAKAREDFYKENPDLLNWQKAVGEVMEELIDKHPDKKYDELLPEVAVETRRRLNLVKQAGDKEDPPPLPKKKGGRRQTLEPDLTDFDREVAEMDKVLEF